MMKFLGLMFLSILVAIGRLPTALGIDQSPQKNRRIRHDGATATLKANQLRDGAGTIMRRTIGGLSGFWRFDNNPHLAAT